jgi:hypothetical protein
MTTVNANAPISYALNNDTSTTASLVSLISLLAKISPATTGGAGNSNASAGGAGSGQAGLMQLMATLLSAMTGKSADPEAGATTGKTPGPINANMGESARKLGMLESKFGNTEGGQKALNMLSTAMPNLTTAQFDDAVKTLEQFANSPANAGDKTTDKGQVTGYELNLLKSQIDGAVKANTEKPASGAPGKEGADGPSSGDPLLDALLSALKQIAKGGVSSDEASSLAQIMALLFSMLMPKQDQGAALEQLFGNQSGGAANSSGANSSGGNGTGISVGIQVNGLNTSGSGGSYSAGYTPAAPTRGNNYDAMLFLKNDLYSSAAAANFDPNSSSNRAYELFMGALSPSSLSSSSGSQSTNKLNQTSMT